MPIKSEKIKIEMSLIVDCIHLVWLARKSIAKMLADGEK